MDSEKPTLDSEREQIAENAPVAGNDRAGGDDASSFKSVHVALAVVAVWGYGIAAEHGVEALMPWVITDWTSWKFHMLQSMSTGAIWIAAIASVAVIGVASMFTGLRYHRLPRNAGRLYLISLVVVQILIVKDI